MLRPDKIGARLKQIRGFATGEAFAERLGVTAASVSRYEAGQIPHPELLDKYSELGKVTVDWILYGGKGESDVRDPPSPYGRLESTDINLVKELTALLEQADAEIKSFMRLQIRLLWRAVKSSRKTGTNDV